MTRDEFIERCVIAAMAQPHMGVHATRATIATIFAKWTWDEAIALAEEGERRGFFEPEPAPVSDGIVCHKCGVRS